MSLKLIFLFLLIKGSQNETPQNVIQVFQGPVQFHGCSDSSEKHRRIIDCHEGRHSPVSDALLFAPSRLQGEHYDEKRQAETVILNP